MKYALSLRTESIEFRYLIRYCVLLSNVSTKLRAQKQKTMDTEKLSFEQAIQELEQLVSEMEQGEITLEQSLAHFERGISLARHSQQLLSKAEQRVQMLTNDQGRDELVDFHQADSE